MDSVFTDTENSSSSDFSGEYAEDLSYSSLQDIPNSVLQRALELRALSLANNLLSPCTGQKIAAFRNLVKLDISNNGLIQLREELSGLVKLRTLIARNNFLCSETIPKSLATMKTLEVVNVSGNQFVDVPPIFLKLEKLRYLHMGANQIKELPTQIKELTHLEVLYLGGNQLTEIPSEVGCLSKLSTLALCDNNIHTLPRSLIHLGKLRSLSLHNNQLSTLPQEIVSLDLVELSLRNNPLVVRFVKDLVCDPPSLLELAGRTIKVEKLKYGREDIPENLQNYLESAKSCVNPKCKGITMLFRLVCFIQLLLMSCDGHGRKTVDDYVHTCMNGRHHKLKPGPEGTLYKQCSPWKDRSCCRENVSKEMHLDDWYNFSFHHCGRLSQKCHSHFIQDLCFYECTPNGGPWIVKDTGMNIRKERYFNLPLCYDECENWWNSCKDDKTCTENWTRGFDWAGGKNMCPKNTKCKKFDEIFKSAKDFCEKVWDHSWKVVPKGKPCFKIWFEEANNPNDIVALEEAQRTVSGSPNVSIGHLSFTNIITSYLCLYLMDW